MPDNPRKAPSTCPHCGFVQHEPVSLISTYCRSCGSYYEVGVTALAPAKKSAGLVRLAVSKIASRPPRSIHCHRCGHNHDVSGYAQSTICPGCNAAIQLEDLTFVSNVSRPIDTRGSITVEEGAALNGSLTICGDAYIRGRINGALICEGTLHLSCTQRLGNSIKALALVVDKGADVEIVQPVKTRDLEVNGRVHGNFECSGRVRISKRGVLEGRIVARSVIVEPGGSLLASSTIQPVRHEELPPAGPKTSEKKSDSTFDGDNPLPAY